MKKILLGYCFVAISVLLQAQSWTGATASQPTTAKVSLISGDMQSSDLQLGISGYSTTSVQTPNGRQQIINMEGTTRILRAGAPDLPKVTTSLIIPDNAEMQVQITNSTYVEYQNIDIAPSKGNFTRDIDPASVPYTYGPAYSTNAFYPGTLAELKDPFIMRDLRGQTVVFYPYQYNPVTKVLRVYTNMEVSVTQTGLSTNNVFTRTKALTSFDPEFGEIYKHQFINFTNQHKYTPVGETGKMLIICPSSFMSAMQPFVNWKITEGMPTEIVDVATIGTTAAAIKTYVANYYNTNGLTFLLLVGDAAQIPTNVTTNGDSDPTYGYITGGDYYQEVLVGRFSAENVAQVQTQVARSVNYEKTPSATSGKFNHAVAIGSDQGPGDDSEYDYTHQRNILTDLLGFTYTTRAEIFDGSQGGVDATGDATAAQVAAEINSGSGIITYTGHGASDQFVTSGFSSSDVDALTNTNVLPFIWSVACVNGDFVSNTCFAEYWLRRVYNGQPAGAVATLMSTINQSWNPPMEGQDEMVDILVESYTNNIKRTFGGLSVNGIYKMNDTYSDFAMTDTWTLFGDPSLMVRTDDPATMTVTHTPSLGIGATSLTVNCNANGALICVSMNNTILGTATVSGGTATINFTALAAIDTLTVCATKFNYSPYLGSVLITNSTGPYLAYASNVVQDPTGNNNAKVDFSENIGLNVTLHNYGSAAANGVTANLSSSDSYITITDNNNTFGNIAASADGTQANAYAFTVANNIPDQHNILFNLNIQDNASTSWPATFSLLANAPVLEIGNMSIHDASGNNNGALDINETADVIINTMNNGHAGAPGTFGVLTTATPQYVTINTGSQNLGTLAQSGAANATFNITVNASAPASSIVELIYTVTSGAYSTNYHYLLTLGLANEDWETNGFTHFAWTQGGDVPWTIISASPYEGTYCAKSGAITDNQTSTLSVTMEALAADTISFWKKVSSEADYDFLSFYLDGTMKEQWSGTVAWSKESYPVTAGTHTYQWEYSKDIMESAGSDCAWIDYILFPPVASGYVNIGENESMNNSLQCNPNPVTNQANISFTLAGKGNVSLKVVDLTGRTIADLLNETQKPAGTYNFSFNTSDYKSGMYFIVMTSDRETKMIKMIVAK